MCNTENVQFATPRCLLHTSSIGVKSQLLQCSLRYAVRKSKHTIVITECHAGRMKQLGTLQSIMMAWRAVGQLSPTMQQRARGVTADVSICR
jgi:hypothetical protein